MKTLNVSVSSPWGLAFDGDYLWVADFNTHRIYQINTLNDSVIKSIEAPGFAPTGLSWDGNGLWITDSSRPGDIFKIDLSSRKCVFQGW